ncbi:hypothetical protein Tco_1435741, partial [Tanacetum coccineum]
MYQKRIRLTALQIRGFGILLERRAQGQTLNPDIGPIVV